MATAPVATQSKTPMVVMAAATSAITEASPFVVRSSFTLPQAPVAIAEWANKNGIKKVVTLVSDYAPGIDAEKFFADRIVLNSGTVLDKLRTPLRSPDFAPVLQKVRDAKPDALFVFLPLGRGAQFMRSSSPSAAWTRPASGLIGTGDVTDDDQLNDMGDVALGVITTAPLLGGAPSAATEVRRVEAFKKANNGMRPNFMAVGGYDGIRVIVEGLKPPRAPAARRCSAAMKGQMGRARAARC